MNPTVLSLKESVKLYDIGRLNSSYNERADYLRKDGDPRACRALKRIEASGLAVYTTCNPWEAKDKIF